MAKSWSDSKGTKNRARWTDEVREHKFPNNSWETIRAVGGVAVICNHWIKAYNKEGKLIQFPIQCAGFDSDAETSDVSKCWACKADVYPSKRYYGNFIVRDMQEQKPAKPRPIKTGAKYMTVKDEGWTPIRVIGLPPTLIDKLLGLKDRNRHKVKNKAGEKVTRTFFHDHLKYGFDIDLKFNPEAKAANQWDIQQGDPTALTDEEKAYLLYDLEVAYLSKYAKSQDEVKKDLIRCGFLDDNGKPLHPEKGIGRITDRPREDDTSSPDEDEDDDSPGVDIGDGKFEDDDDNFEEPTKAESESESESDDDNFEDDDFEDEDDFSPPKEETPKATKGKK